ncbi:MAG: HD domain-containing protein [Bacteroidales bacterium]|nr:HD domain-containing protein [Bacteroidales bacterium]
MQHIVEKAGFQYCGIIHVADGTPRKAYQLTRNQVIPALQAYVEQEIIPRYAAFDKAHQEEHVRHVIAQSLALAKYYPVAVNMVYAVAAYHDTGLAEGRDRHHIASGGIIRRDAQLRRWFREEEIETMAEAAEDHRASAKHEPRSIYGKIVAEADRQIETESVIRRTIQFALSTQTADNQTIDFQDQIKERCWQHTLTHLQEKYGRNGYLKLWIPESPNAENLAQLQALIDNREALAEMFEKIYAKETGGCQNR